MGRKLHHYLLASALVAPCAWAIDCKYEALTPMSSLLDKGPHHWVRLKMKDGSELDGWIAEYHHPGGRFRFVTTGSPADSEGLRLQDKEVQSVTDLGSLKVGAEPSARQRSDAYRSKWPNLIAGTRIAFTSNSGKERKGVFLGFTPEGDLRIRLDGASGENLATAAQLRSIAIEASPSPTPLGLTGRPLPNHYWSGLPVGTEVQFTSVNGNPHQGKILGYTAKGNLLWLEKHSAKPSEVRTGNIETLTVAALAKPPGSPLSVEEIFELPFESRIEFKKGRGTVKGIFGNELRVLEDGADKLTSYPVADVGVVKLLALVPAQTKVLDQNVGKLKDNFTPAAIRMTREDGSPRAYLTVDRRTGEIIHIHSGGAGGKPQATHEANGRLRPDFIQVEAILHGDKKRVEVVGQTGAVDEYYAIGVAEQSLRDFAALPVAEEKAETESPPPPRKPGMLDGIRNLFGR